MSDAINKACQALRSAAARFRDYAEHHAKQIPQGSTNSIPAAKARANEIAAEECESALADLRMLASGDERKK